MRLNRLDLNLLVVLDTILTERSVTQAAARLHLSQPATSGALARLREYFDDELLVRVGQKMQPTPLGESLMEPVHKILLQIQATVEKRPEFDPIGSKRRFRFVLSDYSAEILVPDLIRHAYQLAPSVQFEFISPGDDPEDELEQGNVDFLFMPKNGLSSHHPMRAVFADKFVCVGCADNPEFQQPFSLEQYMKLGHVVVRFGSKRSHSLDDTLMQRYGIQPRVEIVATSFSSVPQYLLGTNRIATMHQRLAERFVKLLPLKILPLPMDLPPIEWCLQWHQYRNFDPGTQWMRDLVLQVAETHSTH